MELGDLVLWLEILTDIAAVNLIEEVSVQSMVIQVTALRQQIAYQSWSCPGAAGLVKALSPSRHGKRTDG